MHNDSVNAVLLSPGKTLTDPLLLLLVAAMLFLVLARRRTRSDRGLLTAALVALLVLAFLSTDVATRLLEWPLRTEASAAAPSVIVVASGGSLAGLTPDLDVLNDSSATRIVTAAAWWHEHPSARLIITGADETAGGASVRTLELMRDVAIQRGVPATAITIESHSFNTREHALRIAALPGITRTTPLGLVTSAWHMRRAQLVFARHFINVIPHPAASRPHALIVNDFLPSSSALRNTTRTLHEWLGIAWYALHR
jgi:uncharacterized SAM-binding protein YcdF (DUF218 family)